MSELRYWVWLSERIKNKNKNAVELLSRFASPEEAYFTRGWELEKMEGLSADVVEALKDKSLTSVNKTLSFCVENGIRIMTLADADYPTRLKNIYVPPLVLYVKGRLPVIDDEVTVAIVGTRSCTTYGLKTAERLSYELTRAGGITVTGLATGVDTAAARGALRAGGRVIGVLGCGIDVVYPRSNAALYEDVAATGALISEYPPGARPEAFHFPERNRIVSGISLGVAVVEAPAKSGALITAACALEQGRDVFAVPGNVDAASCAGSNALLKEGAIPVTSGFDITDTYAVLYPEKLGRAAANESVPLDAESEERLVKAGMRVAKERPKHIRKEIDKEKSISYIDLSVKIEDLSADELAVVSVMDTPSMHVDDIIEASGLSASAVLTALTMLEINGAVTQQPGKKFTSHVSVK